MAEELQKTMTDRQVGSISKNLLDIQIFLKLKAEKQRDQLKEEKKGWRTALQISRSKQQLIRTS
jgi:hypothetical protein